MRRIGFRIGDLQKPAFLEKKLRFVLRLKNETLTRLYDAEPFNEREILDEYLGYAERIDPYIRDIYPLIQDALTGDKRILLEGAQGVMLDIDLGTYPYVTSSSPTAGGACTGSGIPPSRVTQDGRRVQGLHDACRLRTVSDGVDEPARRPAARGRRRSTAPPRVARAGSDGSTRRCLATPSPPTASTRWCSPRSTCSTSSRRLKICTGYMSKGEYWDHPMANISHLKHVEPIYEEFPGWMSPTRECRRYEDLPAACRAYIDRVGELCGASVDVVSVGPDREHTLVRTVAARLRPRRTLGREKWQGAEGHPLPVRKG